MTASHPAFRRIRALVSTALLLAPAALHAQTSSRVHDVVVMQGQELPRLVGSRIDRIVAFRRASGTWQQIPIQVDERDVKDLGAIRQASAIQLPSTVYVDPATWTGPDRDPRFDANDELCFMARHIGNRAEAVRDPAGVIDGSRLLVEVRDPAGLRLGDIYLFLSDGSLQPGAGVNLVGYRYNLLSGNYKQTYNTSSGPNPEDTRVVTRDYELHFSDRWILDRLSIKVGNATQVDILDRHKFQFAPGVCNRSTGTFSNGGGAMIANIDGPIRAIRSVLGANSGRVTQRDWIFTQRRVLIRTYLRVHSIGGTWNFIDYSPAATGMRYFDNNNTGGFPIDGNPDPARLGRIDWQLAAGAQGSAIWSYAVDTNIPNYSSSSFYFDDRNPSWQQCTGDRFAYAAAGPSTGRLPNTDPLLSGTTYRCTYDVHLLVGAPGMTTADARSFHAIAADPLRTITPARAAVFGAGCAGSNGRTPQIGAIGIPQLGSNFGITASRALPNTVALLYTGASRHSWAGQTLPFELGPLGARGCRIYIDLAIGLPLQTDAQGSVNLSFAVPNQTELLGAGLFLQFVLGDPAANAFGLTTTAGLTTALGR